VNDAEKMREKQRLADLKKAGVVEEKVVVEAKKEYDTGYMAKFDLVEDEPAEEDKKDEETVLPKTKIWVDVFSGDQMTSNDRPNELLYNDVCLEV